MTFMLEPELGVPVPTDIKHMDLAKRAAVAFEWSPLTFARSWYEMQLEAPARADIVLKMHSRVMAAIWVCFSRADIFERCLLL